MTAADRREWTTSAVCVEGLAARAGDWLWIAGNHDPDPAENIGGRSPASWRSAR